MSQFFHIVQVHPVELGEPNLHKVTLESEWDSLVEAETYVRSFNKEFNADTSKHKAVYLGRVNDATGELE